MAIWEIVPGPFLDTNSFAKLTKKQIYFNWGSAVYSTLNAIVTLRVMTPECNSGSASLWGFLDLIIAKAVAL